MSTQMIEVSDRSFLTTDDRLSGFAGSRAASTRLDGSWAKLLQGELEDAVDVALLRATLASTPTLSGSNHSWLV